jgi:4-amino-4-deoxy-L-arabinose transferase-like glycosyltransferase
VSLPDRPAIRYPTKRFIAALVLVFLAQYLFYQREPVFMRFTFSEPLNALFRIDVPNLDNTILAVILLIIGGWLFASALSLGKGPYSSSGIVWRNSTQFSLPARGTRRILDVTASLLLVFLIWRLAVKDANNWLALVWIGVLVLVGVLAYFADRRAGVSLSPRIQRQDVILIAAIFAVGLIIGSYHLEDTPGSLVADEGTFWETARGIAEGNYNPSVFDFGVYTYPVLGSIYQAAFLRMFGFSLWSWRFASVLAGVASVAPTFLLARELFDRRVAVISSFLMTVTPYFLAFERLGYNNSQALFPVTLALFLLFAGWVRKSALYLFLSGVAAGFGFYTYLGARLGLVVAVSFIILLFAEHALQRWRDPAQFSKTRLRAMGVLALVFGLGWIITVLPHFVYGGVVSKPSFTNKTEESLFPSLDYGLAFFPPGELFRDYPQIQIGSHTFFYRADIYLRLLVRGVIRSALVFHHDQLVTEHFVAGPLPGSVAVVFYFLGLVYAIQNLRNKNFLLLLLWFFAGIFLLSVIDTFPPRQTHLVPIIPAMSILIALGVLAVADFIAMASARYQRVVTGTFSFAAVILMTLAGLYNYFYVIPMTYPPYPENIMGFAALALKSPHQFIYVFDNEREKDFVPWMIRNIPNQAIYRTLSRNYLGQFSMMPNMQYVFFFSPEDGDLDPLHNDFSQTLKVEPVPQVYRNREGRAILVSYAFAGR